MNRADFVPFTLLGTVICFISMFVFAHKTDKAKNNQDEQAQQRAGRLLRLSVLLFFVCAILTAFCSIAPQQ